MKLPRATLCSAGLSAMLCAVTMTVAAPALAQSTAFVAIENIKYELIDLDMTDGVLPTITFSIYESRNADSMSLVSDYSTGDFKDERGASVFVPVATNASYVNLPIDLAAQSSVSGSLPAGMAINGSVSVNGPSGSYFASTIASTGTAAFVLSPDSAVRFSMDMTVGADYGANLPMYQEVRADAFGRVITVQELQGGGQQFGGTELLWSLSQDGSGSRSTSFSGLVENRSAAASNNLVYIAAGASILSVPEPETYAMVLAGLAIVQMARRRRARQAKEGLNDCSAVVRFQTEG